MTEKVLKGNVSVTVQDTNQISNVVGYYFDIIQEHTITIKNSITSNYIENKTSINDYISQQPLIITLKGLSGEIVHTPLTIHNGWGVINPRITQRVIERTSPVISKLWPIVSLLPPVDNYTQIAKNTAALVANTVTGLRNVIREYTTNNDEQETRLEEIYRCFMVLRSNNTPLRVETPYKTFDNMYIENLTLKQLDKNYITDIELTLKQINYVTEETTQPNTTVMDKYNAESRTKEANHGKTKGKIVSKVKDICSKFNVFRRKQGVQ